MQESITNEEEKKLTSGLGVQFVCNCEAREGQEMKCNASFRMCMHAIKNAIFMG